jgi:hypothetical protein
MKGIGIVILGAALATGAGDAYAQAQRLEQQLKRTQVSTKVKANRLGGKRKDLLEEAPRKPKATKVEEPKPKGKTRSEIWWEIRRKQKKIF